MHGDTFGKEERDSLTDKGVDDHIADLITCHEFAMCRPQVIDAKRCISYETLMEFYGNELVKKSLEQKHPAFVMNSDETQLFRKAYFPGKVACKRGTRPIVVARDRSGSHVSLYITVSAIGRIVKPNTGEPKGMWTLHCLTMM